MQVSQKHIQMGEAHAVVGTVAWGLVLPLGAILIRLVPSARAWIIHALVMKFGLALFTAGFGTGLWGIFDYSGKVDKVPHAIFGVVIFALAWTQPLSGFSHHYSYRLTQKRTFASTLHIFIGRVLIISGIINGGLGFTVGKDATMGQQVAYAVVAGVIALAYLITSLHFEAKRDSEIQRKNNLGWPAFRDSEDSRLSESAEKI